MELAVLEAAALQAGGCRSLGSIGGVAAPASFAAT